MKESYTRNSQMIPQAALKIAGRGKPAFPCKPDKAPFTPHGFEDATTDQKRINMWWTRWPDALIGMPCGPATGVFVVDVDRLEALGELGHEMPETLTVRTPSGGLHFYLNHVDGITNRTGQLPAGIDIRGEGGYVIAPPSEGYTVEHRAPIADAPGWLLEALRDVPRSASGRSGRTGAGESVPDDGGPIPDGRRNQTLASIGGRLRAFGFERGEIEDALLRTNVERCSPPLPDGEVRRIAASVSRYEPGEGAPPPDAPTAEAVDAIEAALWRAPWAKVGGKTERSIVVELIRLARRHGRLRPDGGIEVHVSHRTLALAAATSRSTVIRAISRSAWMRQGESGGEGVAGSIVLLPRASCYHSNHGDSQGGADEGGCVSLRAPFSSPRLRWSAPGRLRLGKSSEAVIDYLERTGGAATVDDLAAFMHATRVRDFRRRVIDRLEERGIVAVAGEAVTLVDDWLDALNAERQNSGEIRNEQEEDGAYERDMKRYNLQREGFKNRHKNKAEKAPSETDMDEYRATRPALSGAALRAYSVLADPNTRAAQAYAAGGDGDILAGALAAHVGDARGDPAAWKRWQDPVARALAVLDGARAA
jgi:hypothetical protein